MLQAFFGARAVVLRCLGRAGASTAADRLAEREAEKAWREFRKQHPLTKWKYAHPDSHPNLTLPHTPSIESYRELLFRGGWLFPSAGLAESVAAELSKMVPASNTIFDIALHFEKSHSHVDPPSLIQTFATLRNSCLLEPETLGLSQKFKFELPPSLPLYDVLDAEITFLLRVGCTEKKVAFDPKLLQTFFLSPDRSQERLDRIIELSRVPTKAMYCYILRNIGWPAPRKLSPPMFKEALFAVPDVTSRNSESKELAKGMQARLPSFRWREITRFISLMEKGDWIRHGQGDYKRYIFHGAVEDGTDFVDRAVLKALHNKFPLYKITFDPNVATAFTYGSLDQERVQRLLTTESPNVIPVHARPPPPPQVKKLTKQEQKLAEEAAKKELSELKKLAADRKAKRKAAAAAGAKKKPA